MYYNKQHNIIIYFSKKNIFVCIVIYVKESFVIIKKSGC